MTSHTGVPSGHRHDTLAGRRSEGPLAWASPAICSCKSQLKPRLRNNKHHAHSKFLRVHGTSYGRGRAAPQGQGQWRAPSVPRAHLSRPWPAVASSVGGCIHESESVPPISVCSARLGTCGIQGHRAVLVAGCDRQGLPAEISTGVGFSSRTATRDGHAVEAANGPQLFPACMNHHMSHSAGS